ncbi:hypothetical protein BpHYR1_004854 [Brachionus plicatilis]|uniref:Uncharacterized protein n=1 Tax=Brachionus plicatilis TaxID=10195 RepID=A0A3M7SYC8_BRAPC|nr:hypothetical protein BpHYR1_004854 [Brachionus plicatilis]
MIEDRQLFMINLHMKNLYFIFDNRRKSSEFIFPILSKYPQIDISFYFILNLIKSILTISSSRLHSDGELSSLVTIHFLQTLFVDYSQDCQKKNFISDNFNKSKIISFFKRIKILVLMMHRLEKNFEKNYMTFIIQGNSSKNSKNRSLETNEINDLVLHLATMVQSSRILYDDEETNGEQLGSFLHLQMLLVYGMAHGFCTPKLYDAISWVKYSNFLNYLVKRCNTVSSNCLSPHEFINK